MLLLPEIDPMAVENSYISGGLYFPFLDIFILLNKT